MAVEPTSNEKLVEFYEEKGHAVPVTPDAERVIRYDKALALAGVQTGQDVLEIGCNQCVLLEKLRADNVSVRYRGIDISAAAVSRARVKAEVVIQDVSTGIPFPDLSFDAVFMLEVLEHVESPTFVLREIKRVLKKDGIVILSVPNPYHWTEILGHLRREPETERHLSSFNYSTMRTLAESVGFKIEDLCGTYVRIPFSKRLSGRYRVLRTDSVLTRSYIFKMRLA